jgi:sulfate adenylyltransferase subunit 2
MSSQVTVLTHLQRLEAESIHILREVVAETEKPVLLYSIGKDSAVMLHLARKAFFPARPPFPLLHVDTTWKFRDMYALRDRMARESGMELIVYRNPEALARSINPFDHGTLHTDMWKTEGLKQALDKYGFDAAFGGARRDEEKSRAKERFPFRSPASRATTSPRSRRRHPGTPGLRSWLTWKASSSTSLPNNFGRCACRSSGSIARIWIFVASPG